MTKKYYELVASAFAEQMELKADPKRVEMMKILAFSLSEKFAADNPRFDRVRFLESCRVRL